MREIASQGAGNVLAVAGIPNGTGDLPPADISFARLRSALAKPVRHEFAITRPMRTSPVLWRPALHLQQVRITSGRVAVRSIGGGSAHRRAWLARG